MKSINLPSIITTPVDYDNDVVSPKKYDHLKQEFRAFTDLIPKK